MILRNKKSHQSGRSMIEMLGVLAIVGVLSAGGIAGYSMAMQSHKTNQLIERIQLVASRVRSLYKGDYEGISADNMISSGKITSKDLENPFGGTFTLNKGYGGTVRTYFTIVISGNNIPAETCTDLILTYWGEEGVFRGVGISGTGGTEWSWNQGTYPPSDTSAVITACKSGNKSMWVEFK